MRPIPDRLTPLECWPVHKTRQDKTIQYHANYYPLHGAAVFAEGLSGAVASGLGKLNYDI